MEKEYLILWATANIQQLLSENILYDLDGYVDYEPISEEMDELNRLPFRVTYHDEKNQKNTVSINVLVPTMLCEDNNEREQLNINVEGKEMCWVEGKYNITKTIYLDGVYAGDETLNKRIQIYHERNKIEHPVFAYDFEAVLDLALLIGIDDNSITKRKIELSYIKGYDRAWKTYYYY